MKGCEYYQELISRLLDADLTAEEEAALRSHLDSCGECRLIYEAFSGVSGMIAESLEEPPKTLHENIMAEIRRAEIKKKNRRLRPVLTAAACLAVVLIGFFGLKNTLFAAKAVAPMAMYEAAVSEDMAAQEAAPAEAPRPAPAAVAGQNNMLFAAAAAPAEAACAEEPAEAEETADAGYKTEAAEGEYISVANLETMNALRELLAGERTETVTNCPLLYTVCCEEDGSELLIFARGDGTVIYVDNRDGEWYESPCTEEICSNFLAELREK